MIHWFGDKCDLRAPPKPKGTEEQFLLVVRNSSFGIFPGTVPRNGSSFLYPSLETGLVLACVATKAVSVLMLKVVTY